MGSRAYWGKNILIAFLSLFFLLFGINALISAYRYGSITGGATCRFHMDVQR